MRLLGLLLLCVAVAARSSSSSSRGSSSSRRSSSSSSVGRSSSRSSSSSRGSSFSRWFSRGSGSKSKSPSSSSSRGSSSGFSGLSSLFKSSRSSSGSSSNSQRSRGNSAAREKSSSGSSIFSTFSRTPQSSNSRGSSAARASVFSPSAGSASPIGTGVTKQSSFQKIRSKITEAAKKNLPGLAVKAAKKLGPKLISYATRRRTKTGRVQFRGGSGTAVYYPSGRYSSSSYDLSSGSSQLPQQARYEELREEHNETRFTEVETRQPAPEEVFIPYNDDFMEACPEKVDAYLGTIGQEMPNLSFVFEGHHMFLIEDGHLNQTLAINDLFPGVHKVDASVFDDELEIVLLFREREVYGFHWNDTDSEFKALVGFPKLLPSSIPWKPRAAFTWPDGFPILVSDMGETAGYDAYLNKEIKPDNQTVTLENLPQPLRGISDWNGDTAIVITEDKVYQYDLAQKSVVGEPETLTNFFNCFLIEIPSADEKTVQ